MPPKRDVAPENLPLGRKIRQFRTGLGLTLADLANTVGVSSSLISQVERGSASPSIATLNGIAAALNVSIADLFLEPSDQPASANGSRGEAPDGDKAFVVRRGRRRRLAAVQRPRITFELLSSPNRKLEFLMGEFEPGSASPPEPESFVAHPGEEHLLCLEGSVVVIVGGREFSLGEGDSVSFDCTEPHRVENRGTSKAVLVIVLLAV
jgi:transcriptional regulator with XRE-family HTH domain